MDTILRNLQDIGLNEKQARVYVALVDIGKGTAYAVAKRAKIKRPTTYVILDELRQKGLALKIPHSKNQIFIAKPPDELFVDYEERLRNAKRILPELLARVSNKKNGTKTYFFEGKSGVEEAMMYGLDKIAGKELLCFFAKAEKSVSKAYIERDQIFLENDVRIRALAPKHPSLDVFRENDMARGREIRLLPQSLFSPHASVEIAESFVRIFLHKDAQVFIFESADFASLMRQIFELTWKDQSLGKRSES